MESAVSTLAPSSPLGTRLELSSRGRTTSPIGYNSTQEDDDDESSDLGETVHNDDGHAFIQSDDSSLSDTDDSDMAHQIEAAGEGESLLGSDDSSDEAHMSKEEQYMIQDELQRHQSSLSNEPRTNSTVDVFGGERDIWDSISPAALSDNGQDVVANELFKPQRGFASTPEPSFADFFGSSDEMEANQSGYYENDDEELTTDEDSLSDGDSGSTISDVESLSVPLIAHVGSNGYDDNASHPEGEEGVTDAAALDNAIPLLVIEDLDGRLIYARAGDGEAVFGSDGEFEFAGESDEESTDDDTYLSKSRHAIPSHVMGHQEGGLSEADGQLDDGETTDELPDEDMPYPRLLIGSIAPHGGRNARRARQIAAQSRQSSPRIGSPAPSLLSMDNSPQKKKPSTLSNVITLDSDSSETESESGPSHEKTGEDNDMASQATASTSNATDTGTSKPVMGQFMPALAKSVHRAVIDGSHRAPSPFNTLHNMQRDLRRKRSRLQHGEESFDQAVSGPIPWRKRKREPSFDQPETAEPYGSRMPDTLESSPELQPLPDSDQVMDLSEVLDEELLRMGSSEGSSDEAPASEVKPTSRRARSASSGHDQAFARWNRIPMGAFRNAQEHGSLSTTSPMTESYLTHQRPSGTYLLTQALQGGRGFDHPSTPSSAARRPNTPFRRNLSAILDSKASSSPLDRTLSDPAIMSNSRTRRSSLPSSRSSLPRSSLKAGDHTVVGGTFLVSPVLRPVKHRGRSTPKSETEDASPLGMDCSMPPSVSPNVEQRGRKVTKREKRERSARREALRQQQVGL